MYRKYSIPVVFITPAKLADLDYYLLHDAGKMSKTSLCRKFDLNDWKLDKEGKTRIEGRG